MKPLLLIFTALPLFAQEPTAPPPVEKAPPADKPELPASASAPRDDKFLELLRKSPSPESVKPAEEKLSKADAKPATAKSSPKREVTQPKGRTTLLPPVNSEDLEMRIRYRKARTFAERDAAVVAAWDASRAARTDYAKREALKRYYDLIQAKIKAVDPVVADALGERYDKAMKRLSQTRVEPTDPNEEDARQNQ